MRLNLIEMGEGPPVALLHGLFGAAQNFGRVQRALAAAGHRVLALDMRNHGASPHAAGMDYPTMAADVVETLEAAGALPAAVLGHSMGGKAAMALALTRPEAVARLIVADVSPVRYPPRLRGYVAAMRAVPLRSDLTRREADAALASAVPDAVVRGFLLQNLRFETDPPHWRLGLAEIAAAMPEIEGFDGMPEGARYDGPVLVLAGEHSDYVLPEYHPRFRALFAAVEFATVPKAGHWLHSENPAGFLALVERFLAA